MNIGTVAEKSGLPAKTIRYYEDIGLVNPARCANGYRAFDAADLHKLAFIARARSLGFGIDECRLLLSLYEDRARESAEVKVIAEAHLEAIDRKIAELDQLRACLSDLVTHCHGDNRPECPILDALSAGPAATGSPMREVSDRSRRANGHSGNGKVPKIHE